MSAPNRQSNLFAAEDFIKVFRSFKNVNFTAYDFDSIKEALVTYIREQYPEDFNDYIESSEYIAIIELLAYLGTSLAFRTELNSRENVLDTADRRESIIRLARMLSYSPKRNVPARGLLKITGVRTNEDIQDSLGRSLKDRVVFWNDANNTDSFEQFITILNSSFVRNNTYGKPYKSSTIGNIPTDLYQMNNSGVTSLVYPVSLPFVDGRLSVDIVNPDLSSTGIFEERSIDPENAFHLIYRNDSNGLDSKDTGFFVHFRQGELRNKDFRFDYPIENRVIEINDENINEYDVYVQEINDAGEVVSQWYKVPAITGNNIIFNNTDLETRNIYTVITNPDDKISLKFADGNFGDVPKGIFRVWYRKSINRFVNIRPENASNLQVTIPYIGRDSRRYQLNVYLTLEESVNNSAPAETNEDIKLRAPQVFYSQNRMVNAEDYNVFPLTYGNEVEKVRSINRTHSGHSRYIDINDPTGTTQNVILFGEDGAIYKDYEPESTEIELTINSEFEEIVREDLISFIKNVRLNNWYYDNYYHQFIDLNPDTVNYLALGERIRWKTAPDKSKNDTGYFIIPDLIENEEFILSLPADQIYDYALNVNQGDYTFIDTGAYARFINPDDSAVVKTVSIKSIENAGLPTNVNISTIGPVELSGNIDDKWLLLDVVPAFNKDFSDELIAQIVVQMELRNSFGLGYDTRDGAWYLIPGNIIPTTNFDADDFIYTRQAINDTSWVVYVEYIPEEDSSSGISKYKFLSRGTKYVFESEKEVRFFYSDEQRAINIQTGRQAKDEIVVLDLNKKSPVEKWRYSEADELWINDQGLESTSDTLILLRNRQNNENTIEVEHYRYELSGSEYAKEILSDSNYEISTGLITIDYSPEDGDYIEIIYDESVQLDRSIVWNAHKSFILEDGHLDQTKIEIMPADSDEDTVPDYPFSFEDFVNVDYDKVFFVKYTDFDGYEYYKPWRDLYVEYSGVSSISVANQTIDGHEIGDVGLIIFETEAQVQEVLSVMQQYPLPPDGYFYVQAGSVPGWQFSPSGTLIVADGDSLTFTVRATDSLPTIEQVNTCVTDIEFAPPVAITTTLSTGAVTENCSLGVNGFLSPEPPSESDPDDEDLVEFLTLLQGKTIYIKETDQMLTLPYIDETVALTDLEDDAEHLVRIGKSFTLNTDDTQQPLWFKWKHYAPRINRIDPSVSNIIDMYLLTKQYYNEVLLWKNDSKPRSEFPEPSTTDDLRTQFGDLLSYKMLSDEIIFKPAKFKILFGKQADVELRAKFKVVKIPTITVSDNEIKSKVIAAIDEYFNVSLWEYGESFYYTELATYIHQQLSTLIASVVIVPNKEESQFGDLFQIKAEPDELFISTASVLDVEIVNSLTGSNMRTK